MTDLDYLLNAMVRQMQPTETEHAQLRAKLTASIAEHNPMDIQQLVAQIYCHAFRTLTAYRTDTSD